MNPLQPGTSIKPSLAWAVDAREAFQQKAFGQASAICASVLASEPSNIEAIYLLGQIAAAQGRVKDAAHLFNRAVTLAPENAEYLKASASILISLRRYEDGLEASRGAVAMEPTDPHSLEQLAVCYERLGRWDEAIEAYVRVLVLQPDRVDSAINLSRLLRFSGQLSRSIDVARQAVDHHPDDVRVHLQLAASQDSAGLANDALATLRRVVELDSNTPSLHSKLLLNTLYLNNLSREEIFAEHVQWAASHTEKETTQKSTIVYRDSGSQQPLTVGYVSPDFRAYATARFFESIISNHNVNRVKAVCYSDVPLNAHDAVTRRFQSYPTLWRNINGLSDDRVAQQIRADGIDILVDLAGHMSNPRLTLFTKHLAAVQISYAGYPFTTGMKTIDFKITDSFHDPYESSQEIHSETLVRLDPCCWCYRPDDHLPSVSPLPALGNGGRITFAAFNRLVKCSPRILKLWARLLNAVPSSRLMMIVPKGAESDAAILSNFRAAGLDDGRILLVGRKKRGDYMRLWNQVDLALDTYPYNGMTTTCDGLSMGVPTITLAGDRHVSRVGVSLLHAVGLQDLIASDESQFVDIAQKLVSDLPRLAALRAGLRAAMQGSVLCDGKGLTRRFEDLYENLYEQVTPE